MAFAPLSGFGGAGLPGDAPPGLGFGIPGFGGGAGLNLDIGGGAGAGFPGLGALGGIPGFAGWGGPYVPITPLGALGGIKGTASLNYVRPITLYMKDIVTIPHNCIISFFSHFR
jgi:hypothetical protein